MFIVFQLLKRQVSGLVLIVKLLMTHFQRRLPYHPLLSILAILIIAILLLPIVRQPIGMMLVHKIVHLMDNKAFVEIGGLRCQTQVNHSFPTPIVLKMSEAGKPCHGVNV